MIQKRKLDSEMDEEMPAHVEMRTRENIQAGMKAFDPTLPASQFTALFSMVDQAVAPRRLITELLGAFSWLAMLLAAIGLSGVIAYSVSQRTRELGLRLAVGAQRGDVVNLMVGEGFKMAAAGVAIGLVAALVFTRVLNSLLANPGGVRSSGAPPPSTRTASELRGRFRRERRWGAWRHKFAGHPGAGGSRAKPDRRRITNPAR